MKWIISYTVSGFGRFPIDMLRYDRAFPASEVDSGKIHRTFDVSGTWEINVSRYASTKADLPREGRWESFCCRISNIQALKLSV